MDWIEKLAREHGTGGWQTLDDMVRFGRAVAAAEREACAKLCDDRERDARERLRNDIAAGVAYLIGAGIRSRSNDTANGPARSDGPA